MQALHQAPHHSAKKTSNIEQEFEQQKDDFNRSFSAQASKSKVEKQSRCKNGQRSHEQWSSRPRKRQENEERNETQKDERKETKLGFFKTQVKTNTRRT
jgi:hypothetical protein